MYKEHKCSFITRRGTIDSVEVSNSQNARLATPKKIVQNASLSKRGILNIDQIKHKGYTVYSRHGNYTQTTNQGGVTKKKIL